MANNGRFMYVQRSPNGSEHLVLARLLPYFVRQQGRPAQSVATLMSVPGEQPLGGDVPETFVAMLPSPSNQWMAVASFQAGSDFVDINMHIRSMTDPAVGTPLFNEHWFTDIHRADTSTPSFDKYLAVIKANDPNDPLLATADYSVSVEGPESATSPTFAGFAWTTSETLIVSLGLDVVAGSLLGHDVFEVEVSPTDNPIKQLSVNAGKPTVPIAAPLGLTSSNGKVDGEISFNGKLVNFIATGPFKWLAQALFPYRRATMVAGNP